MLCLRAPDTPPLLVTDGLLQAPGQNKHASWSGQHRAVYSIPQRDPCNGEPCPPRSRKPAGLLGRTTQLSSPSLPAPRAERLGQEEGGLAGEKGGMMRCGVPFPQCLPTKLDRAVTVMMVKYGPRSEQCQHSGTLACRKCGKHNRVSVHLFNEPAIHNVSLPGLFQHAHS